MKKWLTGLGVFVGMMLISYLYAFSHQVQQAYFRISHLFNESTYYLSANVSVGMLLMGIAFVAGFLVLAFFAGRRGWKGVKYGLITYGAVPVVGSLCLPFSFASNAWLGAVPIFTLFPWSAPVQPFLLTSGNYTRMAWALPITCLAVCALAVVAYFIGKKSA